MNGKIFCTIESEVIVVSGNVHVHVHVILVSQFSTSLRVRFFKKNPRLDSKIRNNPKMDFAFLY